MMETVATADRSEARRLELAQLRRLEIASVIEATTLALLVVVAVPLRHVWRVDLAVQILGPVHGLAFMAYVWTVLQTVSGGGWPTRAVVRLLLVAFVPFAGFTTPRFVRAHAGALVE